MTWPFDLQFLRPAWLLALGLLPLLAWARQRDARRRSAWRSAVDPHLLPHLLGRSGGGRGSRLAGPATLAGLALVMLALAGPSWRTVPQPLQARGGALVIALDLSSATLANDLPPSRLVQARARLDALLRAHAGEVGLVAWADDAFVVSPITTEAANVAVFLDALAPDVMPVDGHRPERAIALASDLLAQAGHARGDILLLAPGAGDATRRAAARAREAGHRVSVLAMGTPAGAGYRGRDGGIHHSALDLASLQAVAEAGGGRVHAWEAPAADVVAAAGAVGEAGEGAAASPASTRVREDGGYWLLPLAMLLLVGAFRRGAALAMVVLCLLLPVQPTFAASAHAGAAADSGAARGNGGEGPPGGDLWRRADQEAHARSVEAEAAYRRGDFEAAARGFAGLPGADAAYNRGNALARAGRYEAAIAAYDEALEAEPGMADALANRAAVEAAMRRGPPPPGGAGRGDTPPSGGDTGDDNGTQGERPPDAPQDSDGEPRDAGEPPDDAPPDDAPRDPDEPPPPPEGEPDPADDARQQAADQAQREAIERALEAGAAGEPSPEAGKRQAPTADTEREEANAAWLRRVPDDPGALLRARFRNEHLRRRAEER